jgi:hypothetical protein
MKEQQTSWASRGHERKPNAVVRSIYWVADWLGDFGHLVSTTKRGAGRLVMVTVNVVILLCILLASAAHSLELLRYAGASHGIEYVLLVAWEATFIFSSVVVDQGFQRGQPRAIVPWLTFFVGLTFVEASNIIGMADNVVGLLIGIFTPILLLLSKLLLAHQFKNRKKIATQPTEEKAPVQTKDVPINIQEKANENPDQNSTEIQVNIQEKKEEISKPKTLENPEKISKDEPSHTKGSPLIQAGKKSSVKSKKKSNVDLDEIVAIAQRLEAEEKLSRSVLEKEANTTTHYAKKAMTELKKKNQQIGGETDDERRKSDRSLAV